jgi:RimJ/RimL family protein N-acetyltransferase
MATFNLTPTIVGETISLRRLTAEDFDAIYAAASDPLIWEQHPVPLRYQREVFECSFFRDALASGALIITDNASGKVIGSSRYYEWNPEKREVAIGYTFLARSHWGGGTNRELKGLMLDHAFRSAEVVWFHVGVDNIRSRKAVEKIGGKFSHEAGRVINGVVYAHAFYRIDAKDRSES